MLMGTLCSTTIQHGYKYCNRMHGNELVAEPMRALFTHFDKLYYSKSIKYVPSIISLSLSCRTIKKKTHSCI